MALFYIGQSQLSSTAKLNRYRYDPYTEIRLPGKVEMYVPTTRGELPMIKVDYILSSFPLLLKGMLVATIFTLVSLTLSLLFSSILNCIRSFNIRVVNGFLAGYVTFIRGTPLLVQLYIVYYLLPVVGLKLPAYVAGLLAFVMNSTAIMYEVVRGSISSISSGDYEAAAAFGLNRLQLWQSIILPQAIMKMMPQIINELIILLKATPLLAFITIVETFRSAQLIYTSNYRPVEVLIAVAILFFIVNYILSFIGRLIEARLSRRRV